MLIYVSPQDCFCLCMFKVVSCSKYTSSVYVLLYVQLYLRIRITIGNQCISVCTLFMLSYIVFHVASSIFVIDILFSIVLIFRTQVLYSCFMLDFQYCNVFFLYVLCSFLSYVSTFPLIAFYSFFTLSVIITVFFSFTCRSSHLYCFQCYLVYILALYTILLYKVTYHLTCSYVFICFSYFPYLTIIPFPSYQSSQSSNGYVPLLFSLILLFCNIDLCMKLS